MCEISESPTPKRESGGGQRLKATDAADADAEHGSRTQSQTQPGITGILFAAAAPKEPDVVVSGTGKSSGPGQTRRSRKEKSAARRWQEKGLFAASTNYCGLWGLCSAVANCCASRVVSPSGNSWSQLAPIKSGSWPGLNSDSARASRLVRRCGAFSAVLQGVRWGGIAPAKCSGCAIGVSAESGQRTGRVNHWSMSAFAVGAHSADQVATKYRRVLNMKTAQECGEREGWARSRARSTGRRQVLTQGRTGRTGAGPATCLSLCLRLPGSFQGASRQCRLQAGRQAHASRFHESSA